MRTINDRIAADMLNEMPEAKKQQLRKALERNSILTSAYMLSFGTIHIYKEGWYLELEGTRCRFAVWAYDNDGEFKFGRKPNESKLNKLYKESLYFNECDFEKF